MYTTTKQTEIKIQDGNLIMDTKETYHKQPKKNDLYNELILSSIIGLSMFVFMFNSYKYISMNKRLKGKKIK